MAGDSDQDDDSDLFRKAMSGVTPLDSRASNRHIPPHRRPSPANGSQTPTRVAKQHGNAPTLLAATAIDQTELPGEVLFARSGIQKKLIRRLKRGDLWQTGSPYLDLHGVRGHNVAPELERFLDTSVAEGESCVLIVHGKGTRSETKGGVVRPLATAWLRESGHVLAFCSAKPTDGGTGAVYVLLKRQESQSSFFVE